MNVIEQASTYESECNTVDVIMNEKNKMRKKEAKKEGKPLANVRRNNN